ncbi:MAG: ABC transporter ATP-binding protein [Lachnospiraceae bacterium]|nr:ABC transporter ATP-binding protein [Lachnospiraceae bacterium]
MPMGKGRGPMAGGRGPKKVENPGKLLARIISYVFRKYKIQTIFIVVSIFISIFANLQGTMFTKSLIDDYITPLVKSDNPDFTDLKNAIIRVAIFYAIGIIVTFIRERLSVIVTQGTLRDLREDLFTKMQNLPVKYFDTNAHGDIMSIYTNDIDTLRQMISQSIPQIINSVVTFISVFFCMIVLSVPLTVITLLMLVVSLFATKHIAGNSGRYFLEQQNSIGRLNGYIEEMMEGQKVVKVFCHEEESIKDFNEINDALCISANKAHTYANILMPINAQLSHINYAICAMIGGVLALNNITGLTIGGLVSFLSFNRSFSQPISQVSQQLNSIVMALAGAERVFMLLDEEIEIDDGYVELVRCTEDKDGNIVETKEYTGMWAWKHFHQAEGTTDYIRLKGEIVLDDVDFGYVDDKMVLHNIDVYANQGQKIAFVGTTGAGKTTITNLINRFYDIQDGKIRFDGINVNKIKKADLRRSLGVVLQDTNLFTNTVRENIRYGKLDATDEEVVAAAKLANAHNFIKRLPKGYDTVLTGNGSNLSQGQRQLLSIARAAIANPPALILDEATSSIDTRTEKMVQDGMDKLMKGRTTFVIAHRLSTVRNSDCIMVLENGRIIERGTHDELIDQKGKYYQLYTGKTA